MKIKTQKEPLKLLHDDAYYVRRLLEKEEEEMVHQKTIEFMYQREYVNPTNIGKARAEYALGIHQKRILQLEDNIRALRLYAAEKNIEL